MTDNPFPGPRPFRLSILLLNAALILPTPLLYSVKTDSPAYFLIASAILLFAFFRKHYLPVRDRPIIYSITAAVVLTILPDMVIVIDDSRAGIFDLLIRSNLIIPLMVYLAAFSCAFFPYPVRRGMTGACVITALVICGDRFNSARLSNETLAFLNPLLRQYPAVYGFAAAWTVLTIPVYFMFPGKSAVPADAFRPAASILRSFLLFFLLILLPLFAFAAEKYYYENDRLMRAVEYYVLRISARRFLPRHDSRRYRLSAQANLNRPLPPDRRMHDTVLLRAKAASAPGYLRSGVYAFYRHGQWHRRDDFPDPSALPALRRSGLISYSTFTIGRSSAESNGDPVELYFAALNPGDRVPAPGNLAGLEAVADSGEISGNGLLRLKQWRLDGGCTLLLSPGKSDPAWQGPAEPEKIPEYLQIPWDLRVPLEKILAEFSIRPQDGEEAVERFLRRYFDRFTYSLTAENAGKGCDPLLHFLEQSRAGHCEFFASAAVLLLRSAGIPARYVTGFFCGEKSSAGDYYLVRSSHAHAWCEAYLRDKKRWVTFDPTPDAVLETYRRTPPGKSWSLWTDALKMLFQQMFSDLRRGHFAQAVMNFLAGTFSLLLNGLLTIPGMSGLALLVFLLAFRIYRREKTNSRSNRAEPAGTRKALLRELARFERAYAAEKGVRRPEHVALLNFYRETELQEYFLCYERLRYGKEEPSEREIRDFSALTARVLAAFRQKSAGRRRPG